MPGGHHGGPRGPCRQAAPGASRVLGGYLPLPDTALPSLPVAGTPSAALWLPGMRQLSGRLVKGTYSVKRFASSRCDLQGLVDNQSISEAGIRVPVCLQSPPNDRVVLETDAGFVQQTLDYGDDVRLARRYLRPVSVQTVSANTTSVTRTVAVPRMRRYARFACSSSSRRRYRSRTLVSTAIKGSPIPGHARARRHATLRPKPSDRPRDAGGIPKRSPGPGARW